MRDDYEDTRALNELVEEVNKRTKEEDFTDTIEIVDSITNDESSEDVYNNLIASDEDTKKLDNVADAIKDMESKKEEESLESSEDKEDKKDKKKDKKNKESLIDKWKKLSKKKKIVIISCFALILILIITLILVLVLSKKDGKEEKKEDEIIIVKDNYIYENGKLVFIDDKENRLGEYECTNKDENLCYVAYLNNSEDHFEVPINKYENGDLIKQRVKIYLNQYAFVVDQKDDSNKVVSLYDFKNNKTIDDFSSVKSYSDDNVLVLSNKNGEYGLFELKEDGLSKKIDYSYTYMGINNKDSNYVVAKNSKGWYLVDYTGKAKTKAITNEIINYNEDFVVTKKDDKYIVCDYNNEEYIKDYEYIRLIDKDKVAVVKDNNVYIRSVNDSKYNEEGYALNNNNYVEVNTYDKDNKKINSEIAFTTAINNDILSLVIGKDTFLINLIEGTTSMKYDYYSYFNGKLYFYSDDTKATLIGTYTCNNKNEVKDEAFVNCYVARDSVFNDTYVNPYAERKATVPLYNNRYVFVYDSPTLVNEDNMEIKFYDLKDKKIIGTYSKVDSGTTNNDYALKLITTNDTDIIVKKAKADKYGVIKIGSDSAEVPYKITYDYIERYGSYYLMKENNSWSIAYEPGSSSYSFDGKIMNNNTNYVVVKDNNGVKLYTNEQNPVQIGDKTYKYIGINNKVYGAVDNNNKLWVFKYDSNTALNNEGITLKTQDYYGVDNPAFKIQVTGNDVRVKVFDGNNYDDGVLFSLTKGVDNNEGEEQA